MVKAETKGIEVSVKPQYLEEQSNPMYHSYVFMYTITIENKSDFTVQLLRRHWHIFDSNSEHREVEGEGVIGETPVIAPNESFTYSSGCNLVTEMGKMSGTYLVKNLVNEQLFQIIIPEFQLITPGKLN
ncbi:MAG: cobalt transporter [Bacteroidetes bacterium]|jgi:ApaG protein|nr:cobalt transporter [Bacteroidota bacterium]